MTTELEQALRSSADELFLDTPAVDVLARGDRLRRERRRGFALGASGLVALAAIGVAVLGGTGDDRGPAEATGTKDTPALRIASWSGPSTNLSAEQLADVQDACAAQARGLVDEAGPAEAGWLLAGTTPPVAAELRDDLVLTYFRKGRDYQTCALRATEAGGFQVSAQSAGAERVMPADRPVALVTSGASDPGPLGGSLSRVYFVVRTSPEVASVELTVAGVTYDSAADGLGLFWLPEGEVTEAQLDRATVTALDSDGGVLYRSRPGQEW
ncbi:hypothetical protein [Nocardioides sp. 503]|uniref:hypothetical protein n=1 Tax=Nocardioides sp. 503 TaxID=2508326 RepID=UPI0010702392|nr:hypothetical protein [Nocardioides sp. 503]